MPRSGTVPGMGSLPLSECAITQKRLAAGFFGTGIKTNFKPVKLHQRLNLVCTLSTIMSRPRINQGRLFFICITGFLSEIRLGMPFNMYVRYPDHMGTFHDATCPLSTNRRIDHTETRAWFDGVTSEEVVTGLLEFIRRTKKQENVYLCCAAETVIPGQIVQCDSRNGWKRRNEHGF